MLKTIKAKVKNHSVQLPEDLNVEDGIEVTITFNDFDDDLILTEDEIQNIKEAHLEHQQGETRKL